MKKIFIFLTVVLLTVIGILEFDITIAKANENGIGFGFYDEDENVLLVVHRVKNNETLKMHKFQTLFTDEPIADFNIVGYGKKISLAGFGGYNGRQFALSSNNLEGTYTIQLFDSEGTTILSFYVEITGETGIEEEVLQKLGSSQKAYLIADKDGSVKAILEVTVLNTLPSTAKLAPLDFDKCTEEPKFKSIKSGKTKVLKILMDTYDSLDEVKKSCSVSKKNIKKLKAGKKVSLKKYEYDVALAFYFRGYYFGRSGPVSDKTPTYTP